MDERHIIKIRKQDGLINLFIVLLCICGIVITTLAYRLSLRDEPILIKHGINNDLHDLEWSYRDTIVSTGLTETQYQKLIKDRILPQEDIK